MQCFIAEDFNALEKHKQLTEMAGFLPLIALREAERLTGPRAMLSDLPVGSNKPEQETSGDLFLGSPVNLTELIKCGTFLISTIV